MIWFTAAETKRIYYQRDHYASVALVKAGYVPAAPLQPAIAFDFKLLELYRLLNKNHRRLGLQPFIRSIQEYHGSIGIGASAYSFSRAYDCYLTM